MAWAAHRALRKFALGRGILNRNLENKQKIFARNSVTIKDVPGRGSV